MKDILGIALKTGDTVVGTVGSNLVAGIVRREDALGLCIMVDVKGWKGALYEPIQMLFPAEHQLIKVASYGETGEDQVGVVQDAGQDESRSTRDRLYDDAGC